MRKDIKYINALCKIAKRFEFKSLKYIVNDAFHTIQTLYYESKKNKSENTKTHHSLIIHLKVRERDYVY